MKKSFSITTPGHWSRWGTEETFSKFNNILELRSQNDFQLHVKDVEKRRLKIRPSVSTAHGANRKKFSLAHLDAHKKKNVEELKNNNCNDLQDMVIRMEIKYDKIIDILDRKQIPP